MSRILIIEDNPQNMYLISYILKTKNHQIIQATTGEQGIELAIKEKPDLILMDIQLPGMDGFETTKKIRASGADGSIPIVAITSYAMVGDREKVLEAGCNGYIEKPINPDTILDVVEKYLKKREDKNERSRSR